MSFQQKAAEMFLEQFLLHPTLTEINERYRWNQKEHPNYISKQQYDGGKMARDHFLPLLQEYFGHQSNPLPAEVTQHFVRLAQTFAQQGYGHCEWMTNPNASVQGMRLQCLLLQPTFLADECVVPFMLALKDLKYCEPWSFEMWSDYDWQGKTGYHIKQGFGVPQVQGFHRLILTEELWTGESGEMHRIFFASVAQALHLLARERNLVLETLQPRIDLLTRNARGGKRQHHEPWCSASFFDEEIAALRKIGETDERVRAAVEVIEKSGMRHYPHMC